MIKRPVVLAVICLGLFLILQAFIPKAIALRTPSNIDQYSMEGHRTHKRNNYLLQREDGEIGSVENGITYDVEPFDPVRNPEELSAFIVDYANMIRNDVILLDNSVETRTRKRGNKLEKYNNQVISDPPCTCEYSVENVDLGEGSFPRIVEIRNCSKGTCKDPYVCKENLYNITILKLRKRGSVFDTNLHEDLKRKWYAVNTSVSVGCMCSIEPYTFL